LTAVRLKEMLAVLFTPFSSFQPDRQKNNKKNKKQKKLTQSKLIVPASYLVAWRDNNGVLHILLCPS